MLMAVVAWRSVVARLRSCANGTIFRVVECVIEGAFIMNRIHWLMDTDVDGVLSCRWLHDSEEVGGGGGEEGRWMRRNGRISGSAQAGTHGSSASSHDQQSRTHDISLFLTGISKAGKSRKGSLDLGKVLPWTTMATCRQATTPKDEQRAPQKDDSRPLKDG